MSYFAGKYARDDNMNNEEKRRGYSKVNSPLQFSNSFKLNVLIRIPHLRIPAVNDITQFGILEKWDLDKVAHLSSLSVFPVYVFPSVRYFFLSPLVTL